MASEDERARGTAPTVEASASATLPSAAPAGALALGDTAAESSERVAVASAAPLSGAFGRYRIERELGRGGMGVVYAAFDPELERSVALKVLPHRPGDDGRARLLREARAMARLANANVVTVFDVSTHDGRDYVAMELMEGGTLHDWLRAKPRATREIVAAFIAAGRGLAAAHAAGLVHRDFKPANVLRARDGRFAVTDFGLARDSADDAAPAAIRPSASALVPRARHAALDDLTATGWVLGTPLYMAPEQWDNHVVTPATDQFAFCVSLWEATSGGRPYRGETPDELRADIARGPAVLDASRVPRALRAVAARGLDPDPSKRWPTMTALIAALQRAQRRPRRIAIAASAGAVVAALIVAFAWPAHAAACEPQRDPDAIWTPEVRAELLAHGLGDGAELIDRDVRAWHAGWASACRAPAAASVQQRLCLDGVVGHLAAAVDGAGQVGDIDPAAAVVLLGTLVVPTVCDRSAPPRLAARWSDAAEAGLVRLAKYQRDTRAAGEGSDAPLLVPLPPADDPCAQTIAIRVRFALGVVSDDDAALAANAQRCPDDRLLADLIDLELDGAGETYSRTLYDQRLLELEARYDRFDDPITHAQVLDAHAFAAEEDGNRDDAIAQLHAAGLAFESRDLHARAQDDAVAELTDRFGRWTEADEATFAQDVARAKETGGGAIGEAALAALEIEQRWYARPALAHVPRPRVVPSPDWTGHAAGIVVDARGTPVAGATVGAARSLVADALGPAPWLSIDPVFTTTDAAGRFELAGLFPLSAVVAARGDERTPPAWSAPEMRLVLGPTRRVAGVAHVAGAPLRHAVVAVGRPGVKGYDVAVPLAADGTFAITGAPLGPVQVGVLESVRADPGWWTEVAGAGDIDGLTLEVPARTRTLRVVARSAVRARLASASVTVFSGVPPIATARDLASYEYAGYGEAARERNGDLVATLRHLPASGVLTACVAGLFHDASDRAADRDVAAHDADIPVPCTAIEPAQDTVTIEVEPAKREGD